MIEQFYFTHRWYTCRHSQSGQSKPWNYGNKEVPNAPGLEPHCQMQLCVIPWKLVVWRVLNYSAEVQSVYFKAPVDWLFFFLFFVYVLFRRCDTSLWDRSELLNNLTQRNSKDIFPMWHGPVSYLCHIINIWFMIKF